MGHIYPQNTLPKNDPDNRTIAAGIKESKMILALMAVMNTRPGSIWRKKSREGNEIPEIATSVNNIRNRTRQEV